MLQHPEVKFQTLYCTISVARPGAAIVLVRFAGRDVGELGDAPFREVERDLDAHGVVELFIDAREGEGATIDVSAQWAQWLKANKKRFHVVNMLAGTRFIQLSADFVRTFADLGEVMRIFGDVAAFDTELVSAIGRARARAAAAR